MKIRTLILLLVISTTLVGQQTEEWINALNHPKLKQYELLPVNKKSDYLHFDFSKLLIPKHPVLGFIGTDYRRVRINLTSVIKDKQKADNYNVVGFSLVDGNRCDFSGKIIIDQIREYKIMHFGVDNIYKSKGLKSQGVLIGSYTFKENPDQKGSGIFQGVLTLNWYIDKDGLLKYDDIELLSNDSYKNSQYVGRWTKYGLTSGKVCNWGEFRIPYSGKLDIGDGEFLPNPLYRKNGWNDYKEKN